MLCPPVGLISDAVQVRCDLSGTRCAAARAAAGGSAGAQHHGELRQALDPAAPQCALVLLAAATASPTRSETGEAEGIKDPCTTSRNKEMILDIKESRWEKPNFQVEGIVSYCWRRAEH